LQLLFTAINAFFGGVGQKIGQKLWGLEINQLPKGSKPIRRTNKKFKKIKSQN